MVGLDRVAQRLLGVQPVGVTPAHPGRGDETGEAEIGQDRLGGALGDADLGGDVTHACVGMACQEHQHVTVVGEERPPTFLI